MNLANKITLFRVALIPVFLYVLLGSFFIEPIKSYLAAGMFILASATDALDGYIARSRNMITNFGKFMDPLADKLLVSSALIALVGLDRLSSIAVILIISREFIVTGFRLVAVSSDIVIAASWWGKLKTIFQMIMIIYILLDLKTLGTLFEALNGFLVMAACILTIISGLDYILKNLQVLKE